MNTDYSLLCFNSVLVHIDMDVSEERASPFRFEESGSELMVKLVIISALSWIRSYNCEHGGIILLHGIRNVH
jgi:hypothetical protein